VTDSIDFVSAVEAHDPWAIASKIHQETGYWPISFSWPRTDRPIIEACPRSRLLAPQIPGLPYNYNSETEYYGDYAKSELALTWKKGGWDCFRHIEIQACGCVPLMPDSGGIPYGTMVHYPKELITMVVDSLDRLQVRPDDGLREALRGHFENHLTSSAMARYMMRAVNFECDKSSGAYFLDRSLHHTPDYLSIMTLVGWLDIGPVRVANVPAYLKKDWVYTEAIYGRGFGYTCSIDSDRRVANLAEVDEQIPVDNGSNWIVVGSARRNMGVLEELGRIKFPRSRIVLVDGEDSSPDAATLEMYRSVSQHLFIRELHMRM
jgi:hypothetical protein